MAVHHSDVLVAVGARFDDRVTGKVDAFAPQRRDHPHRHRSLVDLQEHQGRHADRGRLQARAAPRWSRPCEQELKDGVPAAVREARQAVAAQIAEWKRDLPAPLRLGRRRHQAPVRDPGDLEPHATARRMIVTGVGQHQMWAAQYYRFKHPRRVVHLGRARHHGLWAADRHGRAGRASRASSSSTSTATAPSDEQPGAGHLLHRAPAGEDRHHQQQPATAWCGSGSASSTRSATARSTCRGIPDWVKLAEAYGCVGLRVTKPSEVVPAHREDAEHARPR